MIGEMVDYRYVAMDTFLGQLSRGSMSGWLSF